MSLSDLQRRIQNELKFLLVQVKNEASFDGRISSDENKILSALKEMISDISSIFVTLCETFGIDINNLTNESVVKLIDETFQFILGHLIDVAKESGKPVTEQQTKLLELIGLRLETKLNDILQNFR